MIVPLHVLHVVPPVSKFLESSFWDEGGRAAMADVQIYFGRSLSRASGNIGTCPRHTCGVSKDRNQAPLESFSEELQEEAGFVASSFCLVWFAAGC